MATAVHQATSRSCRSQVVTSKPDWQLTGNATDKIMLRAIKLLVPALLT
jgi:hypothetical protein